MKHGLPGSSDCSGGDMVRCLWSSIVARQQATVTERRAAKHPVLCSQRTSLKMDTFRQVCTGGPTASDSKVLHSCFVTHPITARCWSKTAKELGKETKPTNTPNRKQDNIVKFSCHFGDWIARICDCLWISWEKCQWLYANEQNVHIKIQKHYQ